MNEAWKELEGYSKYKVSNNGNVLSKYNNKLLKKQIWGNHYYTVALVPDDLSKIKRKCFKVHRLVALLFVNNDNNYDVINHMDGNKLNNNSSNLEWCTHHYNINHAYTTGLNNVTGENNPNAKLNKSQIKVIRRLISYGESRNNIMSNYKIGSTQYYRIKNNIQWCGI